MKTLRLLPLLTSIAFLTACGIDEASVGGDELASEELSGAELELVTTRAKFETFVGKDGQHYFHLLAGNGEKMLVSEGYASKSGALSGINTVKTNAVNPARYLLREAVDGAFYFVLVAGNGQIIAVSEMYSTQSNANRGVATVQSIVKAVVDQGEALQGNARFETFKGLDGRYYFHARAVNGEIVLQSQGYTSKASATTGIASVQTNGTQAARYTVLPAADGKFYFHLKASNGRIIARGQTYETKYNAERGMQGCIELLTGPVGK